MTGKICAVFLQLCTTKNGFIMFAAPILFGIDIAAGFLTYIFSALLYKFFLAEYFKE